ncbi:protein DENND6B [Pelobates fuscus]|uniref:protein DENND6B n=1 Tax=Pelobates fuscus TaxID=191477 RepID=UPI002FE4479B
MASCSFGSNKMANFRSEYKRPLWLNGECREIVGSWSRAGRVSMDTQEDARRCVSREEEMENPESPAACRLPWDCFSAWLDGVCVVTFDLELGQAMELVYPQDIRITEKEKTSICYLSFPDSYSGCLGDTQFTFRMRRSAGQRSVFQEDENYNREAPASLQRDTAHYFGYVYFRQVRDSSVKRGYFQKSLVLLSSLPYSNLFHTLLQLIAPEYFNKLEPCLEAVCNQIDRWPLPEPGLSLSLPIMGLVLQVKIPSRSDITDVSVTNEQQKDQLDPPYHITSVHELDLFRSLQSVLMNLQLLWELVLLGEPLVIMAPSPTISSEIVLALTGCISPLKFCSDFRPYFTIHDSEFKEYTTRTQAPPSLLLGVTNPFFIKTLQHWPHILRVGEPRMSGDLPKQVKLKKTNKIKTLDTKAGMYTSYKPFLHKDKTLIKQLLKGLQKKLPSSTLSSLLRKHLFELTQSFIIPLERYMGSLMPHHSSITPWKNPPQVRPFQQEELLKMLEHTGPQFSSAIKGDWMGLYRRFMKSPHFDGWYRQKQKEMREKLETAHLKVICEANIGTWIKNKSEVEIVDLVLKLRDKLLRAHRQHLPVSSVSLNRLKHHIDAVISSLPDDLQSILHPH